MFMQLGLFWAWIIWFITKHKHPKLSFCMFTELFHRDCFLLCRISHRTCLHGISRGWLIVTVNHTINRPAFVCLSVCLFPISSEVLWPIFAKLGGCMQVDLGIALEGFFFENVNGSTGQRVTFAFHYIIYNASLTPHSCKRRLCCYCI